MNFRTALLCLVVLCSSAVLHADDDKARFDLVGPKIEVRVTRNGVTLPIAQVPNLQGGDKLWVKADLPPTQSNHLILIVAFLRGTTNEPPDNWFTEIDTWDKKKTAEGTTIVVPNEAQQAIMFIAPETGGDFRTLRSAVKGKPGLFIRADADLNEASFEQQRIDRYLAAMKEVPKDDPNAIKEHSAKLAATLALKPNDDCFKQPVDQQVSCLTQSAPPVLMEDGHGQNVAEALSSGPSSDFINAASYTQPVGGGLYSAYVGAAVDLVALVAKLRTAQYSYIPGLTFPENDELSMKLNAPPSFNKPMTVIVVGLPAIQKPKLPPLHAHDPNQVACLLQPKMTIQVEGAPLVYSSSYAHDLVVHLNRTGNPTNLPLVPDAFEGGLVVDKDAKREPLRDALHPAGEKAGVKVGSTSDLTISGSISGYWGFDRFDGPTVMLQQTKGKDWKIVGDTQLLAGQDNKLTLKGDGTACVQHISLASDKAKDMDVSFKPGDKDAKDTLALAVPMKTVQPGGYSLAIQQYGDNDRDKVPLTAYSAGIKLEGVKMHTGDNTAVLTGEGLKDVALVEIAKESFAPADGSDDKTVKLSAKNGVSPANGSDATVKLKDGRTMTVKIDAEAARPGLKLLSLKATPEQTNGSLAVTLGGKDDIPLDGRLTFVVQTKDVFPRTQTIEVAAADGSVKTTLSLAKNNLILQDEHTAVATLDPLKAFGQSAFGKLAMRPVAADGTAGDWTGLGILVRAPHITAIKCADAKSCEVDGSNLFLVQAFGAGKDFAKPTEVPTGFADGKFTVPAPSDGKTLYLKLRDDPGAEATVMLPEPVQTASSAPPALAAPEANPAAAAPSGPQPGGSAATAVPKEAAPVPPNLLFQ